ncbi:hypothetical protein Tco_1136378 [Tanacetum coccineum]
MTDENVPAPAPTISDDQILPFATWVHIRKSNHILDLQKRQKNPIFQIVVDILQNTNFSRAFTASVVESKELKIYSLGSTSGIRACCEALNKKKQKQYILDQFLSVKMEAGTTTTTLTARLPILNPGDYDLWLMRIEQYFLMTDYSLWETRRNEMKARGTLLMALPNKDQLKFHSFKDAKLLMEAIEKRYGGNTESKKVQRTLLKQKYKNFSGSSSEIMDQTFDRSSSTIQNPQNVAFVSSNSTNSNYNNNTNEADNTAYGVSAAYTQCNPTSGDNLKQIDPNDLEEMDLQWEMAMLTIRARRFIQRTGRKLDTNGQRVGFDRTKVVETPTKNALVTQDGIVGYDLSYQVEEEHLINFALMAHTSSGSSSNSDSEVDSCSKSCVKVYATLKEQYDSLSSDYKRSQFNFVSYKAESQVIEKFKTGLGYNVASSTAASPTVESFVNSSEMLENQENNKSKSDKGYHAVPPPFTGNFIPFKHDLTFMDEIVESENMDVITIVTPSNGKKVKSNHEFAGVKSNGDAVEPKTVRKNSFRPPVIEDWNSNDESEV